MGLPIVGRTIAGGAFQSDTGALAPTTFGLEAITVTTPNSLFTVTLRDDVAHGMPVDNLLCFAQKGDNIAGATYREFAISRTGNLAFVVQSVDGAGAATAFAAPDRIIVAVMMPITPGMG